MIKDEKSKVAISIVLYFAIVVLFDFFGYLIADSHGMIAPNRTSGAIIIVGMGLLGIIIFCVMIAPLMKIKLKNYSSGQEQSSFIVFVVSLFVFGGIGFLLGIVTDLYEPWSSEDFAGQILMWSGAMFGVITVFIFDAMCIQKESEARINYMNSLSSEIKEKVEKLGSKEEKRRNIEGIILTSFVCGCLFAFAYGLYAAFSSEPVYTDTSMYYSALKDPFIIACLLALPLCCVAVPIYFKIKTSMDKNIENAVTSVGIVHSCRRIMVNQPGHRYRRPMSLVYEVLILVPTVDGFLRTFVTDKTNGFVTNIQHPYETGEKVTVMYDYTKPNHCKIIQKP